MRNEERDPDDGTLGPCGCSDYHMADCPLMTERGSYYPPEPDDPFDGPDDDPRQWEEN